MQAVSESSSRSTSSDLLGGLFYWPQVDTKGSFHDHVPKEIATIPGAHRENHHPLQPDTAASSSAPVALTVLSSPVGEHLKSLFHFIRSP